MRRLLPTAHIRRIVGGVLLALLVAQWGAQVHAVLHAVLHAVVHAPLQAGVHAPAQVHALETAPAHASSAAQQQGTAADHGDHSASSPVCQLWDHLLLGQAPGSPGLHVQALDWHTRAPAERPAPLFATQAPQAYEARGPPRA